MLESTTDDNGWNSNPQHVEQEEDQEDNKLGNGWNALHHAMKENRPYPEVQAMLSSHPEWAREVDVKRRTALWIGFESRANEASIRAVLESFPQATTIADAEYSRLPLHMALIAGVSAPLVEEILKLHPEAAKGRTIYSYTPLHMALRNKNDVRSIFSTLDAYPRAVELKTHTGETPLHIGMRYSAPLEVMETILSAYPGATAIKASDKSSPLQMAIKNQAPKELIDMVLSANPEVVVQQSLDGRTPLHVAMKYLRTDAGSHVAKRLIDAYPDVVTVVEKSMKTSLHFAMEYLAPEEMLIVVLEAFPPAALSVDAEGNTPLHLGLRQGQTLNCIKRILESRPEAAKRVNRKGQTPLHRGIIQGASQTVLKLVHDAYPEAAMIQDSLALTPLHCLGRAAADYHELLVAITEHPEHSRALRLSEKHGALPLHEAANAGSNTAVHAMLDAYPEAARHMDATGGIPLFRFIQRVANQKGRGHVSQEYGSALVASDTNTIAKLCQCHPEGAETICDNGASPLTILLSECTRAKSFDSLVKRETCRRIQILTTGLRDGLPLRTLCTLRNPVALRAFFSIFDKSGGLQRRNAQLVPVINLNETQLAGWTLLEMIADFYTSESSKILLQIVIDQRDLLLSRSDKRRFKIQANDSIVEFDATGPVSEATMLGVADRAKLAFGVPELKRWGQGYGRFLRKYRLEPDPKHISETCVVVFATEALEGLDGRIHESRVALKFMSNKLAFQGEIEKRRLTNPRFVMPVRACFVADKCTQVDVSHLHDYEFGLEFETELKPYPKIRLKQPGGVSEQPLNYLLVMECGSGIDLHDFISHQNIAGRDLLVVLAIAKEIAKCLQFLNEKCGVVHGDIKARNFVARGVGLEFAAIDLDNSAAIGGTDLMGSKRTSSGYLPPEQASRERRLRMGNKGKQTSVSLDALKAQFEEALATNNISEVVRLSKTLEETQEALDQPSSLPEQLNPVEPSSKYDMWCFGALLYYMSTGQHLFNVDTREEVEDEDLLKLCEWSNKTKSSKLERVKDDWPKMLLSDLLERDASRRPPNWQWVIDSLSSLGHRTSPSSASVPSAVDGPCLSDRLMVFHASPLAFINNDNNTRHAVPLLNFEREEDVLRESLKDAESIGGNIDIVFETATTDRFNAFFAQKTSRVMHLSCHGHKDYLALEDGYGGMHILMVEDLKSLVSVGGGNLQVVFVSACHSARTGQAFVDAGVPHVVCCRVDEQFQDGGAIEFARNFYRALACKNSLKEAFGMAREAVRVSAFISSAELEATNFLLLPEKPDDDPYHDVSVFYTEEVPMYSADRNLGADLVNRVPRLPEFFVGREVTMFEILECLNDADVVRIEGDAGIGRSCVVSAVCRYMLQRPASYPMDFFGWFPPRNDVVAVQDRLYDDLCEILQLAVAENPGGAGGTELMQLPRYTDCWRRIVASTSGTRITLVLDLRPFANTCHSNFERFLKDLLNIARVKVLLISPNPVKVEPAVVNLPWSTSPDPVKAEPTAAHLPWSTPPNPVKAEPAMVHLPWKTPPHQSPPQQKKDLLYHGKRQVSVTIRPLDMHSTALLLGWHTPHVSRRSHDPALWTPSAFAKQLLMPPAGLSETLGTSDAITWSHDRQVQLLRDALYQRIGMGSPSRIHEVATHLTPSEFQSLLDWCEKGDTTVL